MSIVHEIQPLENGTSVPQSIRPKEQVISEALRLGIPREIEHCKWYKPVTVAFDMSKDQVYDPGQLRFAEELAFSLLRQGHTVRGVTSDEADLTIGFHILPSDGRSLYERVEEVPAKATQAVIRNKMKSMIPKNYMTVVSVPENFVDMDKREAEEAGRMIMTRIGSPALILLTPDAQIVMTMEGGAGYERGNIDGMRNRLVTRACAEPVGRPESRHDVILQEEWDASVYPEYLAAMFRKLGEWGYIDRPFDVRRVALSDKRVAEINAVMQWTRQSESAGAIAAPWFTLPDDLRMAADGVIIATRTGRDESDGPIDKRYLQRKNTLPTVLLRKDGKYIPYALGIGDNINVGRPSVEIDEMAAGFVNSPIVRVSWDESQNVWILDPNGPYKMNMIRGFIHGHFNIEEISTQLTLGVPSTQLWESISYNFRDFPYPVGCGSSIQFDATTDAVARSVAIQDPSSPYLFASFDQLDHGAAIVALAKPIPGTKIIPDNPFELLPELLDPQTGSVRLTTQIAQV